MRRAGTEWCPVMEVRKAIYQFALPEALCGIEAEDLRIEV